MVAGLAFLSKKSFNPKNLSNQKTVWEAREAKKLEEKRLHERAQQLQREQEDEDLARVRHGDVGGDRAALNFMYAPPPGVAQETKEKGEEKTALFERQPGDDDAAAAFRAMLASGAAEQEKQQQQDEAALAFSNSSGAALQGTMIDRQFSQTDGRSALEKAVGRRENNNATSLQEQVARFPQLKHAPMAKGMSKNGTSSNVQVNFKPLGTQLRNVQCLACGIWGHSRGDRECTKSGWDPFASKPAAAAVPAATMSLLTRRKVDETERKSVVEKLPDASRRRKRSDSDSSSSSSSDSEDSYERRKRRKRERKKRRRRKEEKRRRRRERSPSPWSDENEEDLRRHEHKKKRKRKRQRYDSNSDSE